MAVTTEITAEMFKPGSDWLKYFFRRISTAISVVKTQNIGKMENPTQYGKRPCPSTVGYGASTVKHRKMIIFL